MSRDFIVTPAAEAELSEAYDWYEERVPGLGSQFLLAADACLGSIVRNSQRYRDTAGCGAQARLA